MTMTRQTHPPGQRLFSLLLAALMVFGMIPVTGTAAVNQEYITEKVADPETLTRPQEIYGDNTLNAGKVTVGKSVSANDITVNGFNVGLTDPNNFLVTVSQTAQVMGLLSETKVPVDVVFVLDTSNSMEGDRVKNMVTAANSAIASLMSANAENRVAVVAFSGSSGAGTSGGAAANVLSSLAHYTGDAATKHLQWVNSTGDVNANGGFIAGRDPATITIRRPNGQNQTKNVLAFRDGTSQGTNIHAGVALGGKILANSAETKTASGVTRMPFLVIMSDGDPTLGAGSLADENWYDPNLMQQIGDVESEDGLGFLPAMTAAYYKGLITEHYFGTGANENNRCFVYTMGLGLSADGLGEMTMDPTGSTGSSYADEFEDYWEAYEKGEAFSVDVEDAEYFYTFTKNSIEATKKYVYGTGLGYTGSYKYNDQYFSATQASDLAQAFDDIVTEISKKAISSPTYVDEFGEDFSGYVSFYDPIGEYMEVKDLKGIVAEGYFYQGVSAAAFLANPGANADFDAALEEVLSTRLHMTASTGVTVNQLRATADGNSITWWGRAYDAGEEDPGMQVVGAAQGDSITYIEASRTANAIPANATHICRSYFFCGTAGGQNPNANSDYLYFIVRVQRSLTAPYQQTVVISAPASLLSVEKVLITENADGSFTAAVEEAIPARVVYEVGLRSDITPENVTTIVANAYKNETVNGAGSPNYYTDSNGEYYTFFTNDWDRSQSVGSHHRGMAHATFDAAADNAFYTYQENTLIVDANGSAVTSDPSGTTAYYVRTYYDWTNATANAEGHYTATKKTQLVRVELPADANLIQEGGKWYIPKGAYTASTLVVNGDDTTKTNNATGTSSVVAHPHRTGDSGNSHYTVYLGNNGKLTVKANTPKPTKTVDIIKPGTFGEIRVEDANGQSVMVGQTLEYIVNAKNTTPETGTITITDTVPAGTSFVSAGNGGVYNAQTGVITWTFNNVAPGADVEATFRVKVELSALDIQVGYIQNQATAKIGGNDYLTNIVINPPEGKKVTVPSTAPGGTVQVGDYLVYSIEFHNDADTASDVTITDIIPTGTTFISADHNGVLENGKVIWNLEGVEPNMGGVVSFVVQVNTDAVVNEEIINDASIQIGTNDPEQTNKTTTIRATGDLELSKEVIIPDGLTPDATSFQLTLTETTGALNGTYSGVTFTNGVAQVAIVDGQVITIEDLPAGITILVTETVPAGFAAGISANGQALIVKDQTASVAVTNTYSVQPLVVTLEGSKTLTGTSPDDEVFGFTVVPCNASGVPTGETGITGEVTLTNGTESIVFGTLTFTAPGTYHYLISEVNGGQHGVTYSTVQYLATIVVADKGDGTLDHTLTLQSRANENDTFADANGVLYTNTYNPIDTSVVLEANKVLNGRDLQAGMFSFVVHEKDGQGNIMVDANGNPVVVTTALNAADGTVTFRAITYDQAGTHTYVISELEGSLHGMTYSTQTFTVTVKVEDVDGQLVATVTYPQGGTTFVNTYKPDDVVAELEAQKILLDDVNGNPLPLEEGRFSFQVLQGQTEVASGNNDASGKVEFSHITYTLEDMKDSLGVIQDSKVFTYTIKEIIPDVGVNPNMFYDKTPITVNVTVTYDGQTGLLNVANVEYVQNAVFTNILNPDTVTLTPEGLKTTSGNVPDGAGFSFSVVDVETGTLVTSGISGASGAISFNPIPYDSDDLGDADSVEFRYWITEDQGGTTSAGVTYDSAKYLMVVTLTRNATKKLVATAEYFTLKDQGDPLNAADYTVAAGAANFSNTYSVSTGTDVTIQVKKALVGRDLGNLKFEFGLYQNGTLVATATNDANGVVTFTRQYPATVLTAFGNGTTATVAYEIRELNNNIHGVDYTQALNNPIQVEVTVSDNGQGGLDAPVVVYYQNGSAIQDPTFTNSYTPDPITVNLEANKSLTGATLTAGQFSFVVLDANDNEVAWANNGSDGKIVFSNLVYDIDDAGQTFTYKVKEVKPTVGADPNMYYDPAVFTVTVTVTYNASTGQLEYVIGYPADMTFDNIQNPATISVIPEGTKTITGTDAAGLKFSFRVMGIGDSTGWYATPTLEATGVSAGQSISGDQINFTALVYNKDHVGKTFYYVIEEVPSAANTITFSTQRYVLAVTVGRNDTNALTTAVQYYTLPAGTTVAGAKDAVWTAATSGDVVFNNEYEGAYAILNIKGTKVMVGNMALTGGEFDFRLQLLNADGTLNTAGIVDGVNVDAANIEFGTLIFTSSQIDDAYLVSNENGVATYEYHVLVSELKPENNAIPGVTYSDAKYYAVIEWVVTTDPGSQQITYGQPAVTEIYAATESNGVYAMSGSNLLTVGEGENRDEKVQDTLEFVNTYTVTGSTDVTIQVNKALDGRDLGNLVFEFGLYQNGTLVATATNAADGTVTFTRQYPASVLETYGDGINATVIYEIRELNNNIHGVDYTEALANPIYVKVTVSDNGQGGLTTPVVKYYSDNALTQELAAPTFTNSYTPDPITVNLEANKSLTGATLTANQFSFVVLDANGDEVAWANNDANGNIVFSDLVYTEAGIHTYTVKEVKPTAGALPNMYYDPAEFDVTVTVTYDEATGVLSSEISYPADMTFDNVQNPLNIFVTPVGSKTTEGNIPDGVGFSFSVIDMNGTLVSAGISGANGDITFNPISYDLSTLGVHNYWIVEDNAGNTQAGITYDATRYLMVVTVTENAMNALEAEVEYFALAENAADATDPANYTEPVAEAAFSNVYRVTQDTVVHIQVNKVLTGRHLQANEFGFSLYHIIGSDEVEVATATNTADGTVNFTRVYNASIIPVGEDTVEVRYVIREKNNNLGGVDYSQAKPIYVKVVVTDRQDGTMKTEVTYYTDAGFTTETDEPTFLNTYSTQDTVYTPVVDKVLDGRDQKDGEFAFLVTDITDIANPKEVSIGISTAAPSGQASPVNFGEITYETAGVYTYRITEVLGNLTNVDYSVALANPIYLKVTVVDNQEGKLVVDSAVYYSDAGFTAKLDAPTFTNSYTPIGTTANLTAEKVLTGRDAVVGEFSFQVMNSASVVVATGGNDANGMVNFSGIGINAQDMGTALVKDFIFAITELNTNQSAVYFDDSTYYAKVTVNNNLAEGKLEVASVSYYSDANCTVPAEVVFNNTYDPAAVSVNIPVIKVLPFKTMNAGDFVFELHDTNGLIGTVTNDANGNAVFTDLLSYTVDDLADVTAVNGVRTKDFVYTVSEKANTAVSANGTYTYDTATYTVTVTLTDDGLGTLSAAVSVVKVTGEETAPADAIVFTNAYDPTDVVLDLTAALDATKTIVDDLGNVLIRKDVVFTFELTDLSGNPVYDVNGNQIAGVADSDDVQSDGSFPINLGEVRYDAPGEYRYLLKESTQTKDGYVLDTRVWCIHVPISYDPVEGKLAVEIGFTHLLTDGVHPIAGDMNADQIAFVNTYDTNDVDLTLTLKKTLTGKELKAEMFTFQLLNQDGTIAAEGENDANGKVSFRLHYTLQDLKGAVSKTFTYTAREILPEGGVKNGITYDPSTYIIKVTVTDNGDGTLTAQVGDTVVGESGSVNTGIEFVNTYDADDVTVEFQAIKRMEGMPLEDGIYHFQLMDGDVVLAEGTNRADGTILFDNELTYTFADMEGQLKKVFHYTMVETKGTQSGVTFDETSFDVTVEVTDNGLGQLEAKVIYSVDENIYDLPVFINIYKPSDTNAVIEANKILDGRDLEEGEFTFQLLDDQNNVIDEVTNAADGSIVFDAIYYDSVGTHIYTIVEVQGDLGGVNYSQAVYTVVVEILDPNYGGKLVKNVLYYDSTGALTDAEDVVFVNTYSAEDSNEIVIEADKALDGKTLEEGEFSFQLKDSEGNVIETVTNDANGKIAFSALEYTFADMAGATTKTFTYTVSEVLGDDTNTTYDNRTYTVTVTVEDDGEGNLTATAAYTLGTASVEEIAFANTYDPDAVSVVVDGTKILTTKPLEAGMFTFQLKDSEGTVIDTVTNAADGSFAFDAVHLEEIGTYEYTVVEVKGSIAGVTYDETVYTVIITVTDENYDGVLESAKTYLIGEEEAEAIEFTNTYLANGTTAVLEALKNLTGKALNPGEFTFQLKDSEGNEIETVTNAADGSVVFAELSFTEVGVYTYTIVEVKGTNAGITYDETVYTATVTVTDEGFDGQLDASVAYSEGTTAVTGVPVFHNTYAAKDLDVVLEAEKVLTGKVLGDKEFTFSLIGENVNETAQNNGQGKITFPAITITAADMVDLQGNPVTVKTFYYTISEVKGTNSGMTYDESKFVAAVTVTDDGQGNLTYAVAYTKSNHSISTEVPVFHNSYAAADVDVVPEANKVLSGKTLTAGEFKFELKAEDGTVLYTLTNDADGKLIFRPITIRAEDMGGAATKTFTYTLSEVNENAKGMTYDTTVYTITVTVTDDGLGKLHAELRYKTGDKTVEAMTFTNTYKGLSTNVEIQAEKVLVGKDLTAGAFTFQLVNKANPDEIYTAVNAADGTVSFQSISFTEAGVYTYELTEIKGDAKGMTYDETVYTVTVTVTDDEKGQMVAVTEIKAGSTVVEEAVFTNTYKALPTTADIQAQKVLLGKNLVEGTFTFQLVNKDNAEEIYTALNGADGSITFQGLTFTEAGVYVYHLSEVKGSDAQVLYDENVYTVIVTVTDDLQGNLKAEVEYEQTPVFTNVYVPTPIDVDLTGKKELVGRDQVAGEFTFEVRDEEGNLITSGTNTADGTIVFDSIKVYGAGEIVLYVTEVEGDAPRMEYDDYTYRVKLVVTNENGVLKAALTYLDGEIVFHNEYVPEIPQTGDDTPVGLYLGLLTSSLLAMAAVLVLYRKKETV